MLIFAKEKVVAPVKKTFIILIIAWLSFILPSYNSMFYPKSTQDTLFVSFIISEFELWDKRIYTH